MIRLVTISLFGLLCLVSASLSAATPPSFFPPRQAAPSVITEEPPTPNDVVGNDFWNDGGDTLTVTIGNATIELSGLSGNPPYTYDIHDDEGNQETGETNPDIAVGPIEFGALRIWFGTAGDDTDLDASGLSTSEQAVIFGFGGDDTITGGPAADFLFGMDGSDKIFGGVGNDIILCGEGDDGPNGYEIDGGDGDDRIWGEGGNDKLIGGKGGDWLILGEGENQEAVGGGTTSSPGDAGFDKIWGGSGKDTIYGDERQISAHTTGGDDNIWTGGGPDIVHGGPSVDTIYVAACEGENSDITICGDGGADIIRLQKNRGTVYGEWEGDESTSAEDDDIFIHDSCGSFDISCGMGNDQVYYGGKGDDVIRGCGGKDTLDGGEGEDFVDGDGGFTGSAFAGNDHC